MTPRGLLEVALPWLQHKAWEPQRGYGPQVRVGLVAAHDTFNTQPLCWRYFCYKVRRPSCTRTAHSRATCFRTSTAPTMRMMRPLQPCAGADLGASFPPPARRHADRCSGCFAQVSRARWDRQREEIDAHAAHASSAKLYDKYALRLSYGLVSGWPPVHFVQPHRVGSLLVGWAGCSGFPTVLLSSEPQQNPNRALICERTGAQMAPHGRDAHAA
jgi:hypothetical protein